MANQATETHTFQAEVRQLLDIVIHSLYTDREIFLRELVSNASDSLEKLRHYQLKGAELYDADLPLEINVITNEETGTITIQDYGIGLTHEELIENLGTIAHSGSKAFAAALKEAKETGADATQLIGQFGVGFYSAFMVADEVKVYTHSYKGEGQSLVWTCDGSGSYTIEEAPDTQRRGAKIVLKLKEEAKDFAKKERVQEILKRYSSFVTHPLKLNHERVNQLDALWMRSKSDVKPEEYTEFYKFQANAFDEPRYTLHFSADAPLAINTLLFVPQENLERFGFGKFEPSVSLYCKKVLIDSKPEGLLPEWLRFLKGVVDSADLPLNISRESMQDSALVQKLSKVITNRFIKFLGEEADKRPEAYAEFYDTFGNFIKEGVSNDFTHKDKLAKLLRFESSLTEGGKLTSLDDYIGRMKDGQDTIYYLQGPSRKSIEEGPYLEAFKAQNIEVLFLYEPIDEFVLGRLGTYSEKKLLSADSAEAALEDVQGEGEPLGETESKELTDWLKERLGEKVKEVKTSKRLVGSPAAALNTDSFMSPNLRRVLRQTQGDDAMPPMQIQLDLNPRHPLVKQLHTLKGTDPELAGLIADQIYDNSMAAAGFVEDPRSMVNRVYDLLNRLAQK
ncbi:MAG: molecular chaperone HtpG [Verrucomicrobiota bacterium JB022]|nr:molecular chaperone HtpG [Verrucomicrobiota bacterium JB022]